MKKFRIQKFYVASSLLLSPLAGVAQPPAGVGAQRHEPVLASITSPVRVTAPQPVTVESNDAVRVIDPAPVGTPEPSARASRSTMPISTSLSEPAGAPSSAPAPGKRSGGTIFKSYLYDAFGPIAILGSAFGAGIQHLRNEPPEWEQGARGYGRRIGSKFGEHAVSTTALYVVSAAFQQDPTYYKCECAGFGRRFGHAIISGITALSPDDKRQFAPGRIIGPLAGGMVSANTWYPDRFGPKDGLRFAAQAFATQFGENLFKEFIFGGKRKP